VERALADSKDSAKPDESYFGKLSHDTIATRLSGSDLIVAMLFVGIYESTALF
jgi:hypothetical protein